MSHIPRPRSSRRRHYTLPTASPAIARGGSAEPPPPAWTGPAGGGLSRRKLLAMGTLVAALSALYIVPGQADSGTGCDFSHTTGNGQHATTTAECVPPLSGSTFAGGDGNLLTAPTTFGSTDWQNV